MARSFRILHTLGRGAFGEVHLAELCTEDDFVQTVAVKWLHQEYSDNVEVVGRLRDEARLLGLLDHPHIVRVQGLTRLNGRLAVLMEAVRGIDLSGQRLPAAAALEVIAAVADALDAAWSSTPPGRTEPLRVVHRDIKPSNIMVTHRGVVKVMDFGVARATFAAREAKTQSQQFGTARYMAPERWLDGIAGAPSDVFSLGITLIELVSGKPVARPRLSREGFEDDIEEALEDLSKWPEIAALCKKMVAFAPADRPSAAEVQQLAQKIEVPSQPLRSWASQLPAPTHQSSDLTGTIVIEEDGATVIFPLSELPTPTLPVPPSPGGRPIRGAVIGATILALAGISLTLCRHAPVPQHPTEENPIEVAVLPIPAPPEPVVERVQPQPAEPKPADPTPVQPAQRPRPVSTPAVAPIPVEPAPFAPEKKRVAVTFILDPEVTATTSYGAMHRTRSTQLVPTGELVRVDARGPSGEFGCTIPVETAPSTWHIQVDSRCVPGG